MIIYYFSLCLILSCSKCTNAPRQTNPEEQTIQAEPEYLYHLNILNKHITNFFDEVIVNADEEDVRLNRLSLLAKIENLYNQIGNIATLNT